MTIVKKLSFLKDLRLAILCILLLGLALRLVNLGIKPYWGDEILSLQIVKHYQSDPVGLVKYLQAVEVHPPLYYLLILGWTKLFGFGEAAVRSLSVVFGLATIWLAYFFGKQFWGGAKSGLLAALLVAVLPMQIIYSQEARPYIIFSFLGLLCFSRLWRYLQTNRKTELVYLAIFSILGLYLHYSFALILLPLILFWIVRMVRAKNFLEYRRILGVIVAIFLGFSLWLPTFFYKIALGQYDLLGLSRSISYARPVYLTESALNQLIWTVRDRQATQIEIFSIFLFKLLLIIFAYRVITSQIKDNDKKFFYYLLFLFATSLILFILSPQSQNYVSIYEKHLLWLSVLFAILLAGVASQLKPKTAAILIVVLMVSLLTFDVKILNYVPFSDPDYLNQPIAQQINKNYQPGDIVIDNFGYDRSNLNYYLASQVSAYGIYPPQLIDWQTDFYASRETLGVLENEAQLRGWPIKAEDVGLKLNYIISQSKARRIWLAFADYEDYQVKAWLEKQGWRHAISSIGKVFPLDLYVAK